MVRKTYLKEFGADGSKPPRDTFGPGSISYVQVILSTESSL
jgi:hypothetical protein